MGKRGVIPVPSPLSGGEGTVCFKLVVPDTQDWLVLIDSLVSLLYRGRAYYDNEGDQLIQALDVGWKVYKSLELISCDIDSTEPTPEIVEIIKYIAQRAEGCCCMINCCCSNTGDVSTNTPQTQENILPEEFSYIEQRLTVPPTDINADSWRCKSAKYIVDAYKGAVTNIANLADVASLNTSATQDSLFITLGAIFPVDGYLIALEVLLLIVDYGIRWLSPSVASGIVSYVESKRGELVDAIYCASDAQEASDAWFDILIGDSPLSLAQKAVAWAFLLSMDFNAHWQSSVDRMNAPAYTDIINNYSDDCTCAVDGGSAGLPAGYELVPMVPEGTPVGVNGGTLSQSGEFYEIMGEANAFVNIEMAEPIYNGSVVPIAQVVGFYCELDSANIINGNSVSHRLLSGSSQISTVNFGGLTNTFLVGEIFAGAVDTETDLQQWLVDNTFRWEDATSACDDPNRRLMSWGIWPDGASNGLINEFIVKLYWVINTTGL